MSWLSDTLTSTIGRKLVMALTGLFLVVFLVVHLTGNFQLLSDDGGLAFNEYAKFMTSNPFIKVTSYGLYFFILLHIVMSIAISRKNRAARPVGYDKVKGSANSSFASRNMGVLGFIILVFLVIHLKSFWYEMHWGVVPMDANGNKDLFLVVSAAFAQWWYVAIYVVCMVGLGFHLSHGFWSAFQSLGINHKKYTPFIKKFGVVYAVVISGAFASIPLIMFFNS